MFYELWIYFRYIIFFSVVLEARVIIVVFMHEIYVLLV